MFHLADKSSKSSQRHQIGRGIARRISKQQQQQQRNAWVRLVEYATVEHNTMFQILIWTPLVLMSLYILIIENGPLFIPKD